MPRHTCRAGSKTRASWSHGSTALRPGASVATVERVRADHEGQREGSPEVIAALEAIRSGDVEGLRVLLDERPDLAGRVHHGAWTTLLEAIAEPDAVGDNLGLRLGVDPRAVELLIEAGTDLDGPLNLAACFNRTELVRMLLAGGADPAPDPARGLTPLEAALYHSSGEAAELLAERGISPLALWSAAALGRVDLLRSLFGTRKPSRTGRTSPTLAGRRARRPATRSKRSSTRRSVSRR